MRKVLLMLTAFAAFMSVNAEVLTPEEALKRLKDDSTAKRAVSAVVSAKPTLLKTTMGTDGEPALYMFASDGDKNLIVVGADDIAAPLLGIVESTAAVDVNSMPPQMQWWLEQYAAEIAYARRNPLAVGISFKSADSRAEENRELIEPMITTQWNQEEPYNRCTPEIDGQQAMTGCVATALAQVMNYHEWPERGSGRCTATMVDMYGKITPLSLDLSTITLDWNSMLDRYAKGSYTDEQATAVANLMKVCGFATQMQYAVAMSGAVSYYAYEALLNNFNYSKSVKYCDRSLYGRDDWEQLIYDSLAEFGPVYYGGRSTIGGHAFVCDGYAGDGFFHFNWGWGGMYDGNFMLSALNPEGIGIGGYIGGFNYMQEAIVGISKPTAGVTEKESELLFNGEIKPTLINNNLQISTRLYVGGNESLEVWLRLAFAPEAGAEPILLADRTTTVFDPNYLYSVPYYVPLSDVLSTNGRYRVQVHYKVDGSDEWKVVKPDGLYADYFVIVADNGNYTLEEIAPAKLEISDVQSPTELYVLPTASTNVMSDTKLSYTVENIGSMEGMWGVAMRLLDADGKLVAVGTGEFLDLIGGERKDVNSQFSFTFYQNPEIGTSYKADIYDPNVDGYPEEAKPLMSLPDVVVKAYENPEITVSDFGLAGGAVSVPANNVELEAKVKCSSNFYNNIVILAFFDGARNCGQYYQQLSISAGETQDFEMTVDLDWAVPGHTYDAGLYVMEIEALSGSLVPVGKAWCKVGILDDSGVETVSSDIDDATLSYDAASAVAIVKAQAGVAAVSLYNLAGALVPAPVNMDGTTATVDLSSVSAGVLLLRAVDGHGNGRTFKLVR